MIKKSLIIFIAMLLLCGCSVKNQQEKVTFSSWGSVSEVKVIKNLISDFENKNPGIKITFMHIPQNYFQKIHLLFASNTAPDVVFINNLYLPIYESKLEDLSGMVNRDYYYEQTIKGMSYNNKLLGIPRDVSNQVFYVNKDIVKLQNENPTVEEILKTAEKVTGQGVFGLSYENKVFWAMPYICYFGGGILDADGRLIIDNEKSKQGINFYKDLVRKYKVAPSESQVGSSTLAQMFINGKIGMYLSGRWMYPKISETAKFNWTVITFPQGEKPLPCDVSGWAISKSSKHKEAAKRFVQFLSSEESSKYFTQTGLIIPARKDTAKFINTDKHNEKAFLEAVEQSETRVVNKDYQRITDKINNDLKL